MTELEEVEPKNLLAIYDLSLDGEHDAKPVREAKDCEDLEGAFQDLPDQGECCRLYIAGELVSRGRLDNHLQKILPLYTNFSSKGFNSLSTQWAKTKSPLGHTLELVTADNGKGFRNLKPIPFTCSIGCYRAVDNALVIVIRIEVQIVFNPANFSIPYDWTQGLRDHNRHREVLNRYIRSFLEENQEHRHCQHIGHSQELRFKLYILQFYRTALRLYEDFSRKVDDYNRTEIYKTFNSTPQTHAWSKTIANAADYDIYLEKATSMSVVAKSLVSVMRETCTEQDLTPEIKCLLSEVESLSNVITSPFSMISNRFARQLDLMNTLRNIQDSRDSRLLNLLACIFLPASLATSLLSMSTRFVDLGPLLYDFCGVIVLFASFLALIFSSFKVYDWTKKKLTIRVDVKNGAMIGDARFYVRLWKALLSFLLVIIWPMVLSSFVVGMVVDVNLGSRILGYGAAGVVGITPIFVVMVYKWSYTIGR